LSIVKQLAGQTATYGISSILGRLLNYLLVPLYTRVFHTGEYGVVTLLYAYVSFVNIIFIYGIDTAYFRFFQSEKGDSKVYSTGLTSIVISSLVLGLGIVLFSQPIAHAITSDTQDVSHLPAYLCWFAGVLACDAISAMPFARLRQENKARRFAFLRLFNILLNVGLNLFFLVLCPMLTKSGQFSSIISFIYDPSIGVGYVFISNFISSLFTLILLFPELSGFRLRIDAELWKRMMRYSFPLLIGGFAGMINETFDRVLIPILIPDKATAMAQVGIYSACYKLSILMTLFIQTFRYAAEPFFFSHASKENAPKIYAMVMNWFIIVCSVIFLGIMLYMDLVKYFIGPEFRSGLKVVPVLLLANLCLGAYWILSIWFKVTGKTRWGAGFTIFGAIITLLFNFWLIPIMGYMGAAWTTLFCYASIMIVAYLVGQRNYPVPYNLRIFFISILSALLLWWISELLAAYFNYELYLKLVINSFLFLGFLASAWLTGRRKNGYLRESF